MHCYGQCTWSWLIYLSASARAGPRSVPTYQGARLYQCWEYCLQSWLPRRTCLASLSSFLLCDHLVLLYNLFFILPPPRLHLFHLTLATRCWPCLGCFWAAERRNLTRAVKGTPIHRFPRILLVSQRKVRRFGSTPAFLTPCGATGTKNTLSWCDRLRLLALVCI